MFEWMGIFYGFKRRIDKVLDSLICTIDTLNCQFPEELIIETVAEYNPVCEGNTIRITATVTGCDNTYQWQLDGVDIDGETGLVLVQSSAAIGEYPYRLKVTQCNGNVVFSDVITMEVIELSFGAYISSEYESICSGGSTLLFSELIPVPDGTTTYQWQESTDLDTWVDIDGETGSVGTYSVENVDFGTSVYIRVVATNGGCSAISDSTTVFMFPDPEVAIEAETNPVCDGGSGVLHSEISGGVGIATYQWQMLSGSTWEDIPGEISADLVTGTLSTGTITYRLVVTQDPGCSAVSNEFMLEVVANPTVEIVAEDETICSDGILYIITNISNDVETYQWQYENAPDSWVDISGETASQLVYDLNVDPAYGVGSHTFRVIVYNNLAIGCETISNEVTVTISNTGACLGQMAGTLFTNLGVPMQGYNLQLFNDADQDVIADGAAIRSIFTNSSGQWAMASLPPGYYLLVVTLPFYTLTSATDSADFGDPVDMFTIYANNPSANRYAISVVRIRSGLVQGNINLIATLT